MLGREFFDVLGHSLGHRTVHTKVRECLNDMEKNTPEMGYIYINVNSGTFYAMLSDNPRTRIVWMFVNSDVLESADGTLIVSQEFFQLLEF